MNIRIPENPNPKHSRMFDDWMKAIGYMGLSDAVAYHWDAEREVWVDHRVREATRKIRNMMKETGSTGEFRIIKEGDGFVLVEYDRR